MPASTKSGPSAEVQNSRKRTGPDLSDDTRESKKIKVDLPSKLKANSEKEKRKRKRKKNTRRASVVIVEAEQSAASKTKPTQRVSPPLVPSEEAVPTSVDKGKGKAKSPLRAHSPSIQPEASTSTAHHAAEIAQLKEQLATQATLIERHETHLNTYQQSLTCQICLDLLYKPYALAPCGHITCYGCLVRWFTSPATPTENNAGSIDEILGSTLARNGAYVRRKKNCPVCRANVVERPVELWDIKDMVTGLVRSNLAEIPVAVTEPAVVAEENNTDPWRNVFRPVRPHRAGGVAGMGFDFDFFLPHHMGMHDAEDGGIYRCIDCHSEIVDGVCSGCERRYAGHPGDGEEDSDFSDDEDDGWGHRMQIQNLLDDEDDEEDDVDYPHLAQQFWPPVFLPHGVEFTDDEDDDDDDFPIVYAPGHRHLVVDQDEDEDEDDADVPLVRGIYEVEEEDGGADDEDDSQYGGSFIDDDEGGIIDVVDDGDGDDDDDEGSDDEIQFVEVPSRTQSRRRPIFVESDDEDADD